MNRAALAITQLYNTTDNEFDNRFHIMMTNLRRKLLETFRDASVDLQLDSDAILNNQSSALIHIQMSACAAADITEDQSQDFGLRLENNLADAIIILQRCFALFGERTSAAFQLEAASLLGLPVD